MSQGGDRGVVVTRVGDGTGGLLFSSDRLILVSSPHLLLLLLLLLLLEVLSGWRFGWLLMLL